MVFDPKVYRNNKDGIGGPGDAAATTTTEDSTLVSLTKAIFGKLGGGTSAVAAQNVSQGSTTLGQTGILTQGAVTTAAPTYVTDKTNPLSLKTNGDLRVSDTAATAILSTLNLSTDGLEGALGIITETAPATDTASSGLNGRLQRVAQRLTSLIALVPASLGAKAAASSFAVTRSTEDAAQIGSLTETAPATDTASSGLNGRLQRIAQRITSLIALVPASLGAKTAANSFAVTLATDDAAVVTLGATADAAATAGGTGSLSAKLRLMTTQLASLVTGTVLAAGSALIGRAVADASAATGGISTTARLASAAASTNATLVKGSAGRIYQASGKNNAAYDVFLVLYDSAANPPVPGTTTIRKKIVCPAGQAFVYDWPVGLSHATGIGYAFTKLVADADTTVLVAADVTAFNLDYV